MYTMQGTGVYSKAYYQENKNIILQRNKQWDEKHKERRQAYNHTYYVAHKPEKVEIPQWLKRTEEDKKLAKKLAARKYKAKKKANK